MPFLVAVGAAYVAYRQKEKENAARLDPGVSLEGKTAISLMPLERNLSVFESPIATISFFNGSWKKASEHLSRRVDEIMERNPWLGGILVMDREDNFNLRIYYDPTGTDKPKGHFEVYDPFVIPISRENTSYEDYALRLEAMGATVASNTEITGKNKPLWKVSIIPDSEDPSSRFALCVSMSHVLGDGYTYYMLFKMLASGVSVECMNPVRVPNFEEAAIEKLGKKEVDYLRNATRKPMLQFPPDKEDPMVFKVFELDNTWLKTTNQRRQSVLDGRSSDIVSTNSAISSWFYQLNEASVGLRAVNLRHRIGGCEVTDHHAGNYIHAIAYTPANYTSIGQIEESLETLKQRGEDPLPAFSWSMTSSVSVSWDSFFRDELVLAADIEQTLHLPLYNLNTLRVLPDRVSIVNTFTLRPKNVNNATRTIGVLVQCRKSVSEKMMKCGVVANELVHIERP